MKICLYTNTVFKIGGVSRVATLLANYWINTHEVTIIATNPDYPYNAGIYHIDPRISTLIDPVLFETESTSLFQLTSRAKKRLEKHFNQEKYDIIISVEAMYSLALAPVIQDLPCQKLAWMHNSYHAYFETENAYLWELDEPFKEAIQFYDQCIVLTHQDQKLFNEAFKLNSYVMENPLTFSVDTVTHSLLNQPSLLTVCRTDMRHKGLDLMAHALVDVFRIYPEWTWTLVGDGPDMHKLEVLIHQLNIEDNVILAGTSYEVATFYQNASIFVLPSRWEGMAMVSLEAIAHGLPVVGFDIGALQEVLGDTFSKQLLAPSYDIHALAKNIIRLIENPQLRLEIGKTARQRSHRFEFNSVAEKWDKLFLE